MAQLDHLTRIKIADEAYGAICAATLGLGQHQRATQLAQAKEACDRFAGTGYWDAGKPLDGSANVVEAISREARFRFSDTYVDFIAAWRNSIPGNPASAL